MNSPRCFLNQPLVPGTTLTLDPVVSHHLCGVLRLRAEADITLFNGLGGEVSARLTEADRRRARALVLEHHAIERESPTPLILCQGMAKGEKMDWIVQKATELGAHSIVLFYSEYAPPLKTSEWGEKKVQHWNKVIQSACEQCGRNRIPVLHPPRRLSDWLTADSAETLPWPATTRHIWLAPEAEASLGEVLLQLRDTNAQTSPQSQQASPRHQSHQSHQTSQAHQPVAIWIGPEGGFSPADTALAMSKGVQSVRAGARILRTETAGLAALAVLQAFLGDW